MVTRGGGADGEMLSKELEVSISLEQALVSWCLVITVRNVMCTSKWLKEEILKVPAIGKQGWTLLGKPRVTFQLCPGFWYPANASWRATDARASS